MEPDNRMDNSMFAVCVKINDKIVGHLKMKMK